MPGHCPTKHWSSSDYPTILTYRALSFTALTPGFFVLFAFLIRFGVVIRLSRKREAYAFGMCKISVIAFSTVVDKPCPLKLSDQLTDFAGHSVLCPGEVKISRKGQRKPGSRSSLTSSPSPAKAVICVAER
jgi:hypothetical protein